MVASPWCAQAGQHVHLASLPIHLACTRPQHMFMPWRAKRIHESPVVDHNILHDAIIHTSFLHKRQSPGFRSNVGLSPPNQTRSHCKITQCSGRRVRLAGEDRRVARARPARRAIPARKVLLGQRATKAQIAAPASPAWMVLKATQVGTDSRVSLGLRVSCCTLGVLDTFLFESMNCRFPYIAIAVNCLIWADPASGRPYQESEREYMAGDGKAWYGNKRSLSWTCCIVLTLRMLCPSVPFNVGCSKPGKELERGNKDVWSAHWQPCQSASPTYPYLQLE